MNIGFDASRAFSDQATGTENYSQQLLEQMLLIDTENKYFVYVRKGSENKFRQFSRNLTVVPINFPYLWTQMGLASQTFKDPLDILFVPAHTLPLIRRPRLPTVMTVHDLGVEYLPASHQLKQQLYLKFITRFQFKTASHLIAVSKATKQDLIEKVGIKSSGVSVVYEGVNFSADLRQKGCQIEETLCKLKLKKKKYFLFVGTIQPRKNLVRLIEAFSLFLLESQHSEVEFKLVIAGKPGWDYAEIYQTPARLGIKDQVVFAGRVENEDLAALYQGATALTYPSLFEGFGLPILEAYFFSCPVITSDRSSMPEIAGKGAILVNPNQADAIMRAMQQIVRHPEKSKQLIQAGEQQLKQFSWEKAARETIAILEKTVREAQ